MLAELQHTTLNFEVRLTPDQAFIEHILAAPPREVVENVSASAHETNRIPDPRILLIRDGEILRLDGIPVDGSIEKSSYLGSTEYTAFKEIKLWANQELYGEEAWFSAPYPENVPIDERIYPVSKIDLGEIHYSKDGHKVLLKRAIILDIDSGALLSIAKNFARKLGRPDPKSAEELRSSPIFFTRDELPMLLAEVAVYTDQIRQVEDGTDLSAKLNTYSKLNVIYQTHQNLQGISVVTYANLRKRAEEEKMIGDKRESCPGKMTAFQAFSKSSEAVTLSGWHDGTCRVCGNSTWVGPCNICKPCEGKL